MTVTKLYLVRHGQSAGNAEGRFGGQAPLRFPSSGTNRHGLRRSHYAKENINAIYSSDLLRAVQTAEPLSKMLDLEIVTSPAFRERNVGVLEGLTFDESKEAHPKDYYALVNRNIHHVITNGESYRQPAKPDNRRTSRDPRDNIRGERVAIFSHTGASVL